MPDKDAVHRQYEGYPYPTRDPRDEAKRLVTGSPGHLLEINHYLFDGRLGHEGQPGHPDRPLRALFAGGGTGDGTIMLATQARDAGIALDIVYLDISSASRAVAEARAAVRQLENIRFLSASLLDLNSLGLGNFDYIDCTGVLHHLPCPQTGLASLAAALAPGGGMGLMVYGRYGRAGVYEAQSALRRLTVNLPDAERVKIARQYLSALPRTNRLRRNPFLGDHLKGDDAGLFDLLLHAQDRAYTVPELIDFLDQGGLKPVTFIEPARYRPENYLTHPALAARARKLDSREGAALAEEVAGNITTHVVYAVPNERAEHPVPAIGEADIVPVLRDVVGAALASSLKPDGSFEAESQGSVFRFPLPTRAKAILRRIDGRLTLLDIHRALMTESGTDIPLEKFLGEAAQLHAAIGGVNRMLLRRRDAA